MNCGKNKTVLILLIGLAVVAVLSLLSALGASAATMVVKSTADGGLRGHKWTTTTTPPNSVQPAVTGDNQAAGDDAEACTIAIATGGATVDGRPVLWKNRDFFGRPDTWQAILFWHEPTGQELSAAYPITDSFSYVAVSDRGDRSDPQDVAETLYYPRMGANEKGLAVVSAQAHTLEDDIQEDMVGDSSQDPQGIRNGGLNHWLLSRCETITDVEQLLTDTNDGGGYNGSTARNTASLIAVIDRFGGAAIFEVDGNSFARENITKEFTILDERSHSVGSPTGGYTGLDYRSNFSRITFTNPHNGFLYFVDDDNDGVHDWETSQSSIDRWGRVAARMDDAPKDYRYFIQKWLRTGGHPRENYLEIVARSVGYAPYLSSPEGDWMQEKLVGYHLNRFVTVSSAVIVGSKAGDQDEGRLTTMWVALGEPSVAIFVPVFPYAGRPPAVLDDFFLSINAKRRLVYGYETDGKYPVDNMDHGSPYTRLRNVDHSIDLSALFGGNYYGEGGLQAYNFAIEERLFGEYSKVMDRWRGSLITPFTLTTWQEEWVGWAAEKYVKSDPTVNVYEAETAFKHTSGQIATSNTITAWQFLQDGSMSLSHTHDFIGPTIIEVIARGVSDEGDWPRMRVWISDTFPMSLTEVGGETGVDYTVVVSPAHATNKAKSVGGDLDDVTSRFALYRYRTTYTGAAELHIEVISATVTATVDVDKVLLRTEPRSVEMYEVERDWDHISTTGVDTWQTYIRIKDASGYFDTYHYLWGRPLTVEVAIDRVDNELPWPEMGLYYTRTTGDSGWKQIGVTVTLNTSYAVHSFYLPASDFEGEAAFRIRSGNDSDIRVDKLLVRESLPVKPNTAPTGYFTMDSTVNGSTMTITATAVVTDPDGDAIASYFWTFGDGESYCSGNPAITYTCDITETCCSPTLYATDHRGKTAIIRPFWIWLPIILRSSYQ
jgi:hypothetical protein